ncbi:putative LRR receptor-like serine/threonine-protein kinase [Apostasia shenzhenica]|uniref:Putative LRR receptor-like serine/threonine-protein kinase n=1 Tax=Apostasia shenzhenica TaxID=1088818 RepID=A0A2I0A7X5_9ASPA|nr:putative LRR receptor-like serine/threonine-protein kinase [Apostasia shenzhenica]
MVKSKIRDDRGAMDGWDINSVDPCTWNMVGCSPDGLVISLPLSSDAYAISTDGIYNPYCSYTSKSLLLQNNDISGTLPGEIGMLSQLKILDLSHNQFIGEIPGSIGLLKQLVYL